MILFCSCVPWTVDCLYTIRTLADFTDGLDFSQHTEGKLIIEIAALQ